MTRECSIIFGKGVTSAGPGSVQGLHLVVSDIETARAHLVARGVDLVLRDGGEDDLPDDDVEERE